MRKSLKLSELFQRRLRQLRPMARNERGVAAIEFGLLALPFFAIMAAIAETAILILMTQILDAGLAEATRRIRTGQAHSSNWTITEFKQDVCDELYGLFNCANVRIYVQPIGDFSSATFDKNVVDTTDGTWSATENYNHGGSSQVMLARAYYKWPTMFDIFSFNLATLPDNTYLMGSAQLFKNEPF